jgi:hypothetical protein
MRRPQAGEEEGGDEEGGEEDDDDGDFGAGATASSSSNDARVVVVTRRESLAACRRAVAIIAGPVAAAPGSVIRDPAVAFVAANDAAASAAAAAAAAMTVPSLRVPLRHRPALSACTVSYVIGNSRFGAILDTGSPFLMVPAPPGDGTCRPNYEWGCLRPSDIRPTTTTTTGAGLRPTTERFDGNEGRVDWREGRFSFLPPMDADTTEERTRAQTALFPRSSSMAFGIASESLMDGPGGVFLGLVKHADRRIRPSFLGQSDVSAFSVDLRNDGDGGGGGGADGRGAGGKALTLYGSAPYARDAAGERAVDASAAGRTRPDDDARMLPPTRNAIPLVRDLHRKYGDPTVHYVGVASNIKVNGYDLVPPPSATRTTTTRRKKVYCIFDTGCSGMVVSPSLFDARYDDARANREKSLWGKVDVEFATGSGGIVLLRADRPITTPLGNDDRPWGRSLDGHAIVVLGLAFFEGVMMTVDIDGDRIWFED